MLVGRDGHAGCRNHPRGHPTGPPGVGAALAAQDDLAPRAAPRPGPGGVPAGRQGAPNHRLEPAVPSRPGHVPPGLPEARGRHPHRHLCQGRAHQRAGGVPRCAHGDGGQGRPRRTVHLRPRVPAVGRVLAAREAGHLVQRFDAPRLHGGPAPRLGRRRPLGRLGRPGGLAWRRRCLLCGPGWCGRSRDRVRLRGRRALPRPAPGPAPRRGRGHRRWRRRRRARARTVPRHA
mmetsp:Transcript_35860/g.107795  ORF Transcript_35860/g.107795 Transcript_35860/m.107795 type:complete len:232 (-) Transcript_35860:106-801(-)